jgi:hypothetical protein
MHGLMERFPVASRKRRPSTSKAAIACEPLEDRKLLSGFAFPGVSMIGDGPSGMRGAEMVSFRGGRQQGLFGGGSLGLGGAMKNPILLLTAPLLEGGSGSTTAPSPSVFSSSSVRQAFQTLQTDLKNDIPTNTQPTHASVGALQDDLDAIRKGTLSGTAAQTKIQVDQAAILASMGLTQAQITQIQSDQQALSSAIQSGTSTTTSTSTSTSGSSTTTTSSSSSTSTSTAGTWSAVQTAMQTLQTDLQNDTPSGSTPTHASIGAVEDDLDAIRKGTLTGTTAVTQVQTDAAAVLSSMGLTAAQITQIQTDQQAVETAIQANSSSSTTTAAQATESTLQSVAAYIVGLPGVGAFGIRELGGGGWGGGSGWGGGFAGGGSRGAFMGWR